MGERLPYAAILPQAYQALRGLDQATGDLGLDKALLELVKVRVSQINRCAFCIDMHTKDARALGESEQRLYGLSAWRETPYYSERERAALAWAESVTLLIDSVPDRLYEETRKWFADDELVGLTLAVVAINSWNRFAISFRTLPGSYRGHQ
ncbi:MAG: carboxymuconolactone decarboxylase family protein [Thermaerobacter sp.]|nr:carboxymuconolactone decarboxylase family protein [Thermaerobacter sp.]